MHAAAGAVLSRVLWTSLSAQDLECLLVLSGGFKDMLTRACLLLQDMWARVQIENAEKAQLGTGKAYDRQLP